MVIFFELALGEFGGHFSIICSVALPYLSPFFKLPGLHVEIAQQTFFSDFSQNFACSQNKEFCGEIVLLCDSPTIMSSIKMCHGGKEKDSF